MNGDGHEKARIRQVRGIRAIWSGTPGSNRRPSPWQGDAPSSFMKVLAADQHSQKIDRAILAVTRARQRGGLLQVTRVWSRSHRIDAGLIHSARSDTAGSTRVARRAGIQLASRADMTSTAAVDASVSGSVVLTRYTSDASTRVPARAPARPTATPASARRRPDPTTIRCTSDESAPSAIRMPISRVRCATEYAVTP